MGTTNNTASTRLRVVIQIGGDSEPRVFDRIVSAPASDIHAYMGDSVQAFNEALNAALGQARAAHYEPNRAA